MFKDRRMILLCTVILIISIIISGCGGTTTTEPAPAEVGETQEETIPEKTEAPAEGVEAPAEEVAEKKVVSIIFTQEFDTLNPLYTNMWFSMVTFELWNGWAWQFDEKNQAYPYLVKEMPSIENGGISEDGTTITMRLREDLKWSDGEPLTSDDFIFTYKMAIDTNNAVASAYPYDMVTSMEAPDDYTVVMKFERTICPVASNVLEGYFAGTRSTAGV